MGRLRRGHSLEVIFEEEFPADLQSSIDQMEELTDVEEWDKHPKRLSRRHILQEQEPIQHQEYSNPESVQVTLCSSCCLQADMDNNTPPQQQQQGVARRRNSTYLALACANAVSQGAMTRSLRQMFETQPIRETQPLLSRAEIKQAIQAARLRRNSIAVCPSSPEPEMVTAVPAVVIDVASKEPSPVVSQVATSSMETARPAVSMSPQMVGGVRCDKCSSILTTSPVSLVIKTGADQVPEEESAGRNKSPAKMIPTNREVVEEELPKPDTVKNARCLFESSLMEVTGSGFSTLQPIKSNPSSKILRSESTMTLDRAGIRTCSVGGPSRPPFRWPSRQEQVRSARSPSPSPSMSPVPAVTVPVKSHKMSSTLPSYYRSSPSLTQYRWSRHSLHSTDVESYVSEGGSDCWSSDLESEASYSSGSRDESGSDPLDGMRYISPDVMEKIRSYGMTLTFVNGKMVDEDDDVEEPEQVAKQAATRKVVQSIRSAGQSQPIVAKKSAPPVALKKVKEYPAEQVIHPQQPRIVACLAKPTERPLSSNNNNNNNLKKNKNRHSSGESSTSSGVSSGTNAGSDGSEHNSPFATLKRTKSADADHTVERSPSPGPRQSGTVKAIGSSPFGCYSVVYSFDASARSPMYV